MAAVRGVFVSLGALLLIGILLITMIAGRERAEEQTRIELEYLQNRLASEYLDVLDRATIPRTIAIKAKSALKDSSRPTSEGTLLGIIRDDVASTVTTEYEELGIPLSNVDFVLTSLSWSQQDSWIITLEYEYRLEATSNPGIRWEIDGTGEVDVSVVGFVHPEFDDVDRYGRISRAFWGQNASDLTCVLKSIDSSVSCGPGTFQLCSASRYPGECV